jgi:predicted membrane protein
VTTGISDLSSNRGISMFIMVIAYPTLDSILIVPAIVILLSFRKEPVWFTPWIFESAGIFLMAISDSWFALVVVTSLLNQFWLSALFFASHYIIISAGLLWYVTFLIREKDSTSAKIPTGKIAAGDSKARIASAELSHNNSHAKRSENERKGRKYIRY